MGSFSIWHWLVVGVVVLVFFGGRGKLSEFMGDAAKGIKAFKKGLAEDDAPAPAAEEKVINHQNTTSAPAESATEKKVS
jgi:sec-independent protein translocase protein TatA